MNKLLKAMSNLLFQDPVIPQSVERTGIWPYTGNPKEWIDRSDPNYTPSIYAETPRFDVTGVGVINPVMGSAEGIVPMLRRKMALENVSRGKPTGDLIDELARGIWLHGRGQYPKTGETFAQSRVRVGNLGEPHGLSLTADKELLKRSFATNKYKDEMLEKLVNKQNELSSKGIQWSDDAEAQGLAEAYSKMFETDAPSFARVFPKFGGIPKEKILPAWKAPETEWSQKIIKEAYIESLPKDLKISLKKLIEKNPSKVQDEINNLQKRYNQLGEEYENLTYKWFKADLEGKKEIAPLKEKIAQEKNKIGDKLRGLDNVDKPSQLIKNRLNKYVSESTISNFNKRISETLQRKGYKALMYSPARYNEYEMRMLNPDDVVMLDFRKQSDPALQRMYSPPDTDKYISYENKKSAGRGSQLKRMRKIKEQAAPREGASLRDIYSTITWDDIDRVLNGKNKGKKIIKELTK